MARSGTDGDSRSIKRWIRRMGVVGFLFFFAKGLLWLIVPALLAQRLL